MSWYYVQDGDPTGPVEQPDFEGLVGSGTIKVDTLVWQEGMGDWQPYAEVTATTGRTAPIVAAPRAALGLAGGACPRCGQTFRADEILHIGGIAACASCRPLARLGNRAFAAILSAMALTLAGCGLTKEYITIGYTPMAGVERVPGADAVEVRAEVTDARTNKENVGKKGNEYDFLGPIVPQADLSDTIAKAIEAELLSRGFQIKEGALVVLAEMSKFHNDFKGFPEKAVAELIMSVQVKKPDGQVAFVRSITGQGIKSGVLLRSGANAKAALDKALADAVSKLFHDPAFIDALLKARTRQ